MDTLKKKVVMQSAYFYLKLPPVTKTVFHHFACQSFQRQTFDVRQRILRKHTKRKKLFLLSGAEFFFFCIGPVQSSPVLITEWFCTNANTCRGPCTINNCQLHFRNFFHLNTVNYTSLGCIYGGTLTTDFCWDFKNA